MNDGDPAAVGSTIVVRNVCVYMKLWNCSSPSSSQMQPSAI